MVGGGGGEDKEQPLTEQQGAKAASKRERNGKDAKPAKSQLKAVCALRLHLSLPETIICGPVLSSSFRGALQSGATARRGSSLVNHQGDKICQI